MLGVLIFDTLPGLIIGVVDSLLLLLYRVSRPHVAVLGEIPGSGGQWGDTAHHPEDRAMSAVAVLRVESGLFFANTDHVRAAIEEAALADGVRAVVLDCETMPYVDVTGARMLNQLAADLPRQGVRLFLAGPIGQVRDMVAAVSDYHRTPEYHRTVHEAVTAAQAAPTGAPATDNRRQGGQMGEAIGGSLPLAVGIALSPIPIMAVVLMLTSRKAKVNGPAFVVDWLLGLGVVGAIVLALGRIGRRQRLMGLRLPG
jgi:anti-anti-sigma factor